MFDVIGVTKGHGFCGVIKVKNYRFFNINISYISIIILTVLVITLLREINLMLITISFRDGELNTYKRKHIEVTEKLVGKLENLFI